MGIRADFSFAFDRMVFEEAGMGGVGPRGFLLFYGDFGVIFFTFDKQRRINR